MTEKEKMIAGKMYFAGGEELVGERLRAKDLCHRFNFHIRPSDLAAREALLRELLGEIRGSFYMEPTFWCDYGYNITLGDHFYSNHELVIIDCAPVVFGENVFIGPNCGFYTAGHPIDYERRNAEQEFAKPITVGDNVWIGGGVRVMPGVTIGSNVVIGGGSVVTKDIPDNVVAVGNPCKVLRPITEDDKRREP